MNYANQFINPNNSNTFMNMEMNQQTNKQTNKQEDLQNEINKLENEKNTLNILIERVSEIFNPLQEKINHNEKRANEINIMEQKQRSYEKPIIKERYDVNDIVGYVKEHHFNNYDDYILYKDEMNKLYLKCRNNRQRARNHKNIALNIQKSKQYNKLLDEIEEYEDKIKVIDNRINEINNEFTEMNNKLNELKNRRKGNSMFPQPIQVN